MRIAIFYTGYLPGEKYGGPVTSIFNFTELLGDENDLYIICTNHDLKETSPYPEIKEGWNQVGKSKVMYLSDKQYRREQFSIILDEIKPDLIYASSIFSVTQTYPLLTLSKKKRIPMLLAPRGELNDNALSIKKTKKKAYLIMLRLLKKLKTIYFQATSEEEKNNIIQNLGIEAGNVFLLPNVPSMPLNKKAIKKEAGKLKMCFVGRIVENKNLLVALTAVSAVKQSIEIEFDIIGPTEDKDYFHECERMMNCVPSNIKTIYKGALSPHQMNTTYLAYDCLISPTKFENYGQAIVEAMLHDVPVIISKNTTPWNDLEEYFAGYTVRIDDIAGFTKTIESLAAMDESQYYSLIIRLRAYCQYKFDYATLKSKYKKAMNEMISRI